MKAFRRILCVLLTLSMVFSMCACFGGSKEKMPEKQVVENVYKLETHPLPEGMQYVNSFYKADDGYLLYGDIYDEEEQLYTTKFVKLDDNFEFVEFIDFDTKSEDGYDYWVNGITPASDGTYWACLNANYYDEENDYYESKNMLSHLAPDMTTIESRDLRDILGLDKDMYAYIYNIIALDDGKIAFMNDGILYIMDGEYNILWKKESAEFNNAQYLNAILKSPKGVVVTYSDMDWNNKAVILDTATMSISEEYDFSKLGYNFYPGSGEYDLYYIENDGFYGYRFGEETGEELMNYMNSDLNNFFPQNLIPTGENRFICTMWDPDDGNEMCIAELVPVPDSEAVPKYIITLGCLYLNYRIREQVYKFNRSNDEYRIVLKDYSANIDYREGSEFTYDDAIAKLNSDIASGDVPDLFVCSQELPFDSYAAKGLFIDLYEFMDADPDMSRDKFEANVLKAFETSGKLYRIAPQFSVYGYAGLERIVGTYADNWNTDAFLSLASSLPEGSTMFQDMTRALMINEFMYGMYGEFVDADTGKCTFDDGSFAKLLEYSKTLNEKSIYDVIDWSNVDDSFWQEMDNALPEGRIALSSMYVSSFSDITSWINYTFKTDEIVLLGFPTSTGNPLIQDNNGTIAISSRSKLKDGAWQFVKSLLSDEYQNNLDWELPVRTSALEAMMEEQIKQSQEQKKWSEENGGGDYIIDDGFAVTMPAVTAVAEEVIVEEAVDFNGDGVIDKDDVVEPTNKRKFVYLDEELAGMMLDYIRSADMLYQSNVEVQKIVNEEATRFFEGKCSSAQAADAVQSRVSVYISESR